MLRRLRIGTRVNMLIVLPVLALLALATGGVWATQRVGLGSEEFQRLQLVDDLRATVTQPTASLLPSWAKVNEAAALALGPDADDPTNQEAIEKLLKEIDTLRATQAEVLRYWAEQDLDQITSDVLADSGASGSGFWEIYDAQFVQALRSGDRRAIAEASDALRGAFDEESQVTDRISKLVELERETQTDTIDNFVQGLRILLLVAGMILVVISILLAVFVRRSIVQPIKSLAAHAVNVADQSLPSAVRQAAEGGQANLEMFRVDKGGELAELGRSLNSMQEVALELAVDQARARQTVSENLVNIARRNQTLLGRTLSLISTLEKDERDPAKLDQLFDLDHLTTRMRRNAQSLLVLAEAEPSRRFASAAPISDVVRAALSEVERYSQVELGELGQGYLQGALLPEVAHLLAELIENATSFSPPNATVSVVGRSVADGHQLVIIDYGLGMSAEELSMANSRLSRVTAFDQESSRMLGFHVVSRLAARHGIKVMLTATPGGRGTTAIVRLPSSVLDVAPATASGSSTANTDEVPVTWQQPSIGGMASAPVVPSEPPAPVVPPTLEPEAVPSAPASVEPSSPLPTRVPGALRPPDHEPASGWSVGFGDAPMSADAIRELIEGPGAGQAPTLTTSGLARRVRGAQMPDLGQGAEALNVERPAEQVRSSLADLQRGVSLGRLSADGEEIVYQREEDR